MSHPRNKRERFLVGKRKGEKRADGLCGNDSRESEWFVRTARAMRDTTKLCSCTMCIGPRRNPWNKGDGKLTTQEIKAKHAAIAQLVEHSTCNRTVAGSTPAGGFENKE